MTPSRKPGPDSTLDEVRVKLIQAGTALLRERGVNLGLGEISLSDAIAKAGVTRSTAYRSLAHDELNPLAVLHRALINNVLTRYSRGDTRALIEAAVTDQLDFHADTLAHGTTAERTQVLRSVIRVGANASYHGVVESAERSILTAMYGSLRSSTDAPDWRHDALVEGERDLNRMFTELYSALMTLFQYRVKAPFTVGQVTTAGASLVEGIAMRHGFNAEIVMIERPTGPGGRLEEWTLFAVALEAMLIGMCEPIDPDNPFADLARH